MKNIAMARGLGMAALKIYANLRLVFAKY